MLAATTAGASSRRWWTGDQVGGSGCFASVLDHRRGRRRLIRGGKSTDGSDESIPTAGQGLDEPRSIRRVPQRIPQPADSRIQAVLKIDERLCRPETLPQLLASHEVARTIQQRLENLKWLFGKIDADAGLPQLARAEIQLERAKANDRVHRSAHRGFSSDRLKTRHSTTPGYLGPYLRDGSRLMR